MPMKLRDNLYLQDCFKKANWLVYNPNSPYLVVRDEVVNLLRLSNILWSVITVVPGDEMANFTTRHAVTMRDLNMYPATDLQIVSSLIFYIVYDRGSLTLFDNIKQ